jgi:hypothetical protein
MIYFNYLLSTFKLPKESATLLFSGKNPMSWQPFFGPWTSISRRVGTG